MDKEIKIEGERIYLRTLKETDASEEYCNWLNDPETNRYLATKKATLDTLKNYINQKTADPNCMFFGIFLKNHDKHIGNVKLEPIDFKNRNAWVGILIGDKKWRGHGIGPEVIKTLVAWTFKNINIKEIYLGVRAANKNAIKAYEKSGFGFIRKEIINEEGKFLDNIIMSITKR